MNQMNSPLIRIGVFYDGNYFLKISDYYYFQHERKARISLEGLHEFIRHQVAEEEDVDVRLAQITDAHFFRGRLSATEARDKDRLFHDRLLDDILMNLGVSTHYMPLKTRDGRLQEKGIDVWLSLEALELALHKTLDVVVLIAGDQLTGKSTAAKALAASLGGDASGTGRLMRAAAENSDVPSLGVPQAALL